MLISADCCYLLCFCLHRRYNEFACPVSANCLCERKCICTYTHEKQHGGAFELAHNLRPELEVSHTNRVTNEM